MKGKLKTSNVIKFILLYSIAIQFLSSVFKLPTVFFYLNDALLIVIAVSCVLHIFQKQMLAIPKSLFISFGVLLLVSVVSYTINQYSPLQYMWGARNNFRMFIYFFACCICLRKKDVYDICKFLMRILPLNVVLTTIEYFMAINSGNELLRDFVGDHVGGIFGNTLGCNRILNVYIIFVYTIALAMLLSKQITKGKFIQVLILCSYMSILSELKIAVLEIALVTVVLVMMMLKKTSKWLYLILAIILIYFLFNIWALFNPAIMHLMTSMEELINYTSASSYGANSLNRMTVIPYMHEVLFDRDTIGSLFGVGLGNADSSGFAFLVSDIYKKYGDLKYSYFMHGMLYMEMGAVGLVSYILFFVLNFFTSLKKANQKGQKPLAYAGTVFNAIAIITIFYNTTLRSEVSCFLTFFILAIPIIWMNREEENEEHYTIMKTKKVKWKIWQ